MQIFKFGFIMLSLGVGALPTGLNNQKMCLIGLAVRAYDDGATVSLPMALVDFVPVHQIPNGGRESVEFWSAFDKQKLIESFPPGLIVEGPPDEILNMRELFALGAKAIKEAMSLKGGTEETVERREVVRRILVGFAAAPPLVSVADSVRNWLAGGAPVVALQLRIEQDWINYLNQKFGTTEVDSSTEFLTVDPAKIFARISACSDFAGPLKIWACCDEADLPLDVVEIKNSAKHFGYEIFFKSDLPADITYPKSRLLRSIIDFEICSRLPVYVGLSRSTFSNNLALLADWDKTNFAKNYLYNAPGSRVIQR